jgi:hypothetical protein
MTCKDAIGILLVTVISLNLSGCGASSADQKKWADLEASLDAFKAERTNVRAKLTANPTGPDAPMMSMEISRLNKLVTGNERALGYHLTQPVTTEPSPVLYTGPLLDSEKKLLKVSDVAWSRLAKGEQVKLAAEWNVKRLGKTEYGVIIDGQTADESTKATSAGAALGSSLGQANYIDRSFKNGGSSYSATGQLAAGVLGALVGAAFDQKAMPVFKVRYYVKFEDGSVNFADVVQGNSFRLPNSMCVEFPSIDTSDQTLCNQTADSIRSKYINRAVAD